MGPQAGHVGALLHEAEGVGKPSDHVAISLQNLWVPFKLHSQVSASLLFFGTYKCLGLDLVNRGI